MRISIEDIPVRGYTLRLDPTQDHRETVGRALDGEVGELEGTLVIERVKGGVVVAATGRAVVQRPCDRCGQGIDVTVETDEHLHYKPAPSTAPSAEVELAEEDLDVGFYTDDVLDTDDVLSEAFALAAPLRVTCGDDSCPNLRFLEDRREDDTTGHPAFEALKKLF